MGIAFVLCGFREFMTDIEIMLDTPMSFTFQVQMRYYAPYAIGVSAIRTESLPIIIGGFKSDHYFRLHTS